MYSSKYDIVRDLVFGMPSPFSLEDAVKAANQMGNVSREIVVAVLAELCSSGLLMLRNGMFYSVDYNVENRAAV